MCTWLHIFIELFNTNLKICDPNNNFTTYILATNIDDKSSKLTLNYRIIRVLRSCYNLGEGVWFDRVP